MSFSLSGGAIEKVLLTGEGRTPSCIGGCKPAREGVKLSKNASCVTFQVSGRLSTIGDISPCGVPPGVKPTPSSRWTFWGRAILVGLDLDRLER